MVRSSKTSRSRPRPRSKFVMRRFWLKMTLSVIGISLLVFMLHSGNKSSQSLFGTNLESKNPSFTNAKQNHPSKSITAASLDVEKACSFSEKINSQNDHLPSTELLGLDEVHSVLKYWYEFNCPLEKSCNFLSIGQHLLHHSIEVNKTLLTVQVGAMNGKDNDPLYQMFVHNRKNYMSVNKRESLFEDLRNWLPIMFEPVPGNYKALIETYTEISKNSGLGCAIPIHSIVSYDSGKTTCSFCHVNLAPDGPEKCKTLPNWMKSQLGQLDCVSMKKFFKERGSAQCILEDALPCSSMGKLLSEKSISLENIAMLQVDVEGYEPTLLEGFFNETEDHMLPPVIHFEHKVLRSRDQSDPLPNGKSRLGDLEKMLRSKGYALHLELEDYLALRVNI